jgi:hypothetical protein
MGRPRNVSSMRAIVSLCAAALATAAMTGTALASSATKAAYQAGVTAFVHGYPPLLSQDSQTTFPVNTLVSIAGLSDPSNRLIVMPNVDTAYSVAKLDLSSGPHTVHLPAEPGRYHMMQLLDAYTNVAGYIGTRTTGNGAVTATVVGPSWHGKVPAGVKLLRSPTNAALLLGRTLARPSDTSEGLRNLVGRYSLDGRAAIVLAKQPARQPGRVPSGMAFVDAFDAFLAANPPSAAERKALAPLRRFGIGALLAGQAHGLPAATRAALLRGIKAGPAAVTARVNHRRDSVSRKHHGWIVLDPDTGDYGTDYWLRAIVARIGLWANTPAEATYPNASNDSTGHPLTGNHRYALTFTTPLPARAFWSLTMYDHAYHLYANPLQRYALGDRSRGLVKHGSKLTIMLSHAAPKTGRANWLPAPAGRFTVTLRLYMPTATALAPGWSPPGIRCLDCKR